MPVHSHDNDQVLNPMGLSPYVGNMSGLTQIYLNGDLSGKKYEVPLIIMVVFLSSLLFCMIVSMLLPASLHSILSCMCHSGRGGRKSFNYIDAALYKTRHTMYRKEVYSQQMKKSLITSNNPAGTGSDSSNRDTELQEITTNSSEPTPSTSVSKPLTTTISQSSTARPPIKIINASQSEHRDAAMLIRQQSMSRDDPPATDKQQTRKYLKTPSVSFNSSFDNSCASEPANFKFHRRQLSQESSPLLNSPDDYTFDSVALSSAAEPPQSAGITLKPALRKQRTHNNYPTATTMSVDTYSLLPHRCNDTESTSCSIMTTSMHTAGHAPVTQSRRAKRMLTRWSTCDSDKRDFDHGASTTSIIDV